MNGRILVLCASRDRQFALARMIASVRRTSTKADIAVYVDDDQADMYDSLVLGSKDKAWVGPRVGPVESMNALWKARPGYEAYGAATDDSEFMTPGWDEWVLETAASFKGGIGFMSPWHGIFNRMDFPWMTAKTAEVMTYFAYPRAKHFYWDVYMEVVGKQTAIKYATKEQFEMSHDGAETDDFDVKLREDALQVMRGIACHAPGEVDRLREAMGAI